MNRVPPSTRPGDPGAPGLAGGGERGVRPYLLTGGRTRSSQLAGGFETLVVVSELGRERAAQVSPEQRALLRLAVGPISVAELSARLGLPLGVTQVLAGDLIGAGLLAQFAGTTDGAKDPALLRRVISAFENI